MREKEKCSSLNIVRRVGTGDLSRVCCAWPAHSAQTLVRCPPELLLRTLLGPMAMQLQELVLMSFEGSC